MRTSAWVRGWRVADKSRATAVSLSPNASARLRPQMLPAGGAGETVPEAVIGGAGAWRPFPLRLRNVPLMGGEMRCSGSICRRLGGSLEDLSPTVSLGEAPSKARGSSRGWSAPPADHPTQLSASNTRRRRTNGETEIDVWEGLAEVRALSEVFSAHLTRSSDFRPGRAS